MLRVQALTAYQQLCVCVDPTRIKYSQDVLELNSPPLLSAGITGKYYQVGGSLLFLFVLLLLLGGGGLSLTM